MSKTSINIPQLRFPEFKDEHVWEEKLLNKVLTIGSGRDYKHLSKGSIPVYGSGGYMLSVDDFLYDGESACIGRKGTINKPVFLSGKFWTVDTLFYTHSFIDCLPKFIYYIFLNINWLNYNEAGGIPSLSKTTIGKIKIPLPKKDEQQKIIDCLTSIDNLILSSSKKVEALKEYKKGLMQQLFPKEGKNVPKRRFLEFKDKWEEKKLKSILLDYKLGGNYSNSNVENKYPLIKMGNIGRGNITLDKIEYIDKIDEVDEIDKIQYGDLFLNTRNTLELVGKVAVWRNELPNAYYNSNLMWMKFENNFFMNYRLNSFQGIQSLRSIATGTTSVAAIYTKDLLNLKLLIPSKEEQKKIANCLTSLDTLINEQTQKVEALKEHKKGLIQQLFPNNEASK